MARTFTKLTKEKQELIIGNIYELIDADPDRSMREIACKVIDNHHLKCDKRYFYGHADNLYDYLDINPDAEYGIVFDSDYISFYFPIMEECKTIWC